MLTVNKLIAQGRGLAAVLLKRATEVELDWDTRSKSRFDATDSAGRHLGVFLPRGSVVRGGDVLVAEDGSLVRVRAAAQPVLVVRPCAQHGSAFDLQRAAYHLGNRHVQLQLGPDRLQFEPDHVLADMLRAMHLIVSEEQAPFEPEAGAYAAGAQASHGHDHGHEDGHGHAHADGDEHGHAHTPGHDHAHAHDHAPAPAARRPAMPPVVGAPVPHVHGPGCNHGPDDQGRDHGQTHGHTHDHTHGHAHDHDAKHGSHRH